MVIGFPNTHRLWHDVIAAIPAIALGNDHA
jgi:hypothetical protein